MATFSQVKEVRLAISDPPGVIKILEVAYYSALPVTPGAQTAYKTQDTGNYYTYQGAWKIAELSVSDEEISSWVDAYGVDVSVKKTVERILAGLPFKLALIKSTFGESSIEFNRLLDVQKFYKEWLSNYSGSTQGRGGVYIKTRNPCIAGGNV